MGAICFFDGYLINLKEIRVTSKGNAVQAFGLSVLTNPNTQEQNERFNIFNFVAFGEIAEQLAKDYQNGKNFAHIQAAPHVEKYVDASGNEKRNVTFWVNKVACYEKPSLKQNSNQGQQFKKPLNTPRPPKPQNEDFF